MPFLLCFCNWFGSKNFCLAYPYSLMLYDNYIFRNFSKEQRKVKRNLHFLGSSFTVSDSWEFFLFIHKYGGCLWLPKELFLWIKKTTYSLFVVTLEASWWGVYGVIHNIFFLSLSYAVILGWNNWTYCVCQHYL